MDDKGFTLNYRRCGGNGTVAVSAELDGEIVVSDKLDIVRASARDRFVARLAELAPVLATPENRAAIGAELLRIAGDVQRAADPQPAGAALDVSRIARPELFHARDVSGVAAPVTRVSAGRPAAQWVLYARWHAKGQRESRDLPDALDLPDGGRLWFCPLPAAPEPTMRAGWSAESRAAWVSGAAAPEPVGVLRRICERFAHFVDFPSGAAEGTTATLALWTVLSYVYPAWAAIPYLSLGGPLASGKSTAFGVLSRLVFRPLESSNLTAPALFRTLHERGGTLLLDEAERLRDGTPDAGELRSILLSGYKAGSPAIRLEKAGESFRRTEFDCFGPKALAGIGSLPEALASRCIRVGMFRAGADSPKPRSRLDAEPERWAAIRDDLHALALEHGADWPALATHAECCPLELNGRDFELWQPLFGLAGWFEERGADGLVGVLGEHALGVAETTRDDAVPEADELLVKLLAEHVLFSTHRTLKAGDLLRQACDLDAVTFRNWSPKGIAAALARYGIRTKRATGNAGRVYGGVGLPELRRIAAAYGFDLSLPPDARM